MVWLKWGFIAISAVLGVFGASKARAAWKAMDCYTRVITIAMFAALVWANVCIGFELNRWFGMAGNGVWLAIFFGCYIARERHVG